MVTAREVVNIQLYMLIHLRPFLRNKVLTILKLLAFGNHPLFLAQNQMWGRK